MDAERRGKRKLIDGMRTAAVDGRGGIRDIRYVAHRGAEYLTVVAEAVSENGTIIRREKTADVTGCGTLMIIFELAELARTAWEEVGLPPGRGRGRIFGNGAASTLWGSVVTGAKVALAGFGALAAFVLTIWALLILAELCAAAMGV